MEVHSIKWCSRHGLIDLRLCSYLDYYSVLAELFACMLPTVHQLNCLPVTVVWDMVLGFLYEYILRESC